MYVKFFICIVLLVFFRIHVLAQSLSWDWAHDNGNKNVRHIKTDFQGNVIVWGSLSGSYTVGSQTLSTPSGKSFLFLAKYTSTGSEIWTKVFGGDDTQYPSAMDLDQYGNICVAGAFSSKQFTLESNVFINALKDPNYGNPDVFVAKFDPQGNLIFAQHFGNIWSDHITGLAINSIGESFVTGSFSSTLSIGNDKLKATKYSSDVFVTKFAVNGSILWSRTFGGGESDLSGDIDTDSQGHVYVCGMYTNSTSINSTTLQGQKGLFLVKLDAAGNQLYVEGLSSSWLNPVNIACDSQDNLLVSGVFSDTLLFGSSVLTSVGATGAFLLKLNGLGMPQWIDPIYTNGFNEMLDFYIDPLDNTILIGNVANDSLLVGQHLITTANNGFGATLLKLDPNGALMWGRSVGGQSLQAISHGGDQQHAIYFGGHLWGTATLGKDTFISEPAKALNVFGKLNENDNLMGYSNNYADDFFDIIPIPAQTHLSVLSKNNDIKKIEILTSLGVILQSWDFDQSGKCTLDIASLPRGCHLCRITGTSTRVKKIMFN